MSAYDGNEHPPNPRSLTVEPRAVTTSWIFILSFDAICQKSDIEELEVGQGLALGESFENDEFFLQRVYWV